MKKPKILYEDVTVSPQVTLKFRVVFHPVVKTLRSTTGDFPHGTDNFVLAFWMAHKVASPLLGEMHFCRQHTQPQIIAHECFHAALALSRRLHLNIENQEAEELLAEAAETMVRNVTNFVRAAKLR